MRLRTTLIICCVAAAAQAGPHGKPTGVASGLRAEFFRTADLKKPIDSRLHPGPWLDDADDLAFHDGRPGAQSARWTGTLHAPADGAYRFHWQVDDEVKLWIGEQLIIDQTETHRDLKSTEVTLTKGEHPVRVEYRNSGGGEIKLQVFWESDRFKRQLFSEATFTTKPWTDMRLVDAEAFNLDGKPVKHRVPGLRGRYYEGRQFDKLVHEQRDTHASIFGDYPIPSGRTEDIAVRWTGTLHVPQDGEYTFEWQSDDGLWIEVGGRLIVEQPRRRGGEAKVELTKGLHPIRIDHNRAPGEGYLQLAWQGPGVEKQILGGEHVWTRPWKKMTDAQPMLVLLMLGHSNMGGRSKKEIDSFHPRTWVFDPEGMQRWHRFDEDNSAMGPLLKRLAEAHPDVRFGAVRVQASAGTLKDDFLPGRRAFKRMVREGQQAAAGHRVAAVVTMIGWVEGGQHRGSPLTFAEDFATMIDGFRREFDDPNLPFVVSQIEEGADSRRKSGDDTWQAVHAAIDRLPQHRDNLIIVPANKHFGDTHHYNHKGYKLWAKQAADGMRKAKLIDYRLDDREALAISKPKTATVDPSKQQTLIVEGTLEQVSKPRPLKELLPYKNLLVTHRYHVDKVVEGKLDNRRILAINFAIRDQKKQPAADYRKGQRYRLTLTDWSNVPQHQGVAIDDDILDFKTRQLFVIEATRIE
ncbi:MAG: PA14 domain-containing protein [Phycisphaerae bacterium]